MKRKAKEAELDVNFTDKEQHKTKRYKQTQLSNDNSLVEQNHRFLLPPLKLIELLSSNKCHYEWLKKLTTHCDQTQIQYNVFLFPEDCVVFYCPKYLPEHTILYKLLWQEMSQIDMQQPKICGHLTPREIEWQTLDTVEHHDGYVFSGQKLPNHPMTPAIKQIMQILDSHIELEFNSVLINRYRKEKVFNKEGQWIQGAGKDSIAPHKDDEELFGDCPIIASLSLGEKRRFIIQREKQIDKITTTHYKREEKENKGKKKSSKFVVEKLEFRLGQGDLLIMGGKTNKLCTHCIPKEKKLKPTQDRYSLTFRKVV